MTTSCGLGLVQSPPAALNALVISSDPPTRTSCNPPRLFPNSTRSAKTYSHIPSHGRRAVKALRIRAAAEVAGSAAILTNKELIKKADAYFETDLRPIVLFDGVCNMCNGGVNFVLDNDRIGRLRFAALQSEAGKALLLRSGRSPTDISSLVLVEKDGAYIKSEGILRTGQNLQAFLPALASLALLFPLFFRDFVYERVADNRYSMFGQTSACRTSDMRFKDRFIE